MGLITLQNCCVLWLLNFLKLKLDSQSRLTVPEFSGYHCSFQNYNYRYLFHTYYENINQELSKISYSRCVVKIRIRKLKFLFSVQLPMELLRYFLFKIFVNSVLQSSFVDTYFNKVVCTI